MLKVLGYRHPLHPRPFLPSAPWWVKTRRGVALFFLLTCLQTLPVRAGELAAWLVRFDLDTPTKIKAICTTQHQNELNRLLVQVRGRADAWYQSDFVPQAEELTRDFDPLAQILTDCDRVTIEAWLNVYYLWTGATPPLTSHHPARYRPWLLQDDQGHSLADYSPLEQQQNWLEGVYADPASLAYRQYFGQVVTELLAKYPLTAIHLDFIRYPGPGFGTGSRLAKLFTQRYGFDPRWLPSELSRSTIAAWYNGSLTVGEEILVTGRLLWDLMRAAEISQMVQKIATIIHQQPDRTLSAAVFADPLMALLAKGQDWPTWLAQGHLDEAFVMLYFGDKERIKGQLSELASLPEQTKQQLWLGLGGYIKDAPEIGKEVCLCREFGFQRFSLFSLGHLQRKKNGLAPFTKQCALAQAGQKRLPQGDYLYQAIKAFQQLSQDHPTRRPANSPRLAQRLSHFLTNKRYLQARIAYLTTSSQQEPFWSKSRGLFRYLNRHDSLAKGEEQWQIIRTARKQLLAGADFNQLSQEISQAGSRHLGGILPRVYQLTPPTFASAVGQVSPILLTANGFWVKQVLALGQGGKKPGRDLPWPAKRLLLRQDLIREQP